MTKDKSIDEVVEEIKGIVLKSKGKLFVQFLTDLGKSKTIQPVNNYERYKYEKECPRIKTFTVIDEILNEGIPAGKSAMLYGEPAAGKTQTCKTLVATCPNRVVYIDAEASFSFERLEQICKERGLDFDKIMKTLILYTPNNWVEQLLCVNSIPAPEEIEAQGLGKIDLIICDSLTKYFRGLEFYGRQTLPLKTGLMRELIIGLEAVAKMHNAALVYTSHITERPSQGMFDTKADLQKPVGGPSVEHQPDFKLFFRTASGNARVVRMMDSSYKPLAEKAFCINEKGIDDLPKESRAAKMYEQSEKKFEKKQSQEDIITGQGKGKKKSDEETNEVLEAEPVENDDENSEE